VRRTLTQQVYLSVANREYMEELLAEPVAELLAVVVYALGAGSLTVTGAFVELTALDSLATGDAVLGGWLAFAGGLALVTGYVVTTSRLVPLVRTLTA